MKFLCHSWKTSMALHRRLTNLTVIVYRIIGNSTNFFSLSVRKASKLYVTGSLSMESIRERIITHTDNFSMPLHHHEISAFSIRYKRAAQCRYNNWTSPQLFIQHNAFNHFDWSLARQCRQHLPPPYHVWTCQWWNHGSLTKTDNYLYCVIFKDIFIDNVAKYHLTWDTT